MAPITALDAIEMLRILGLSVRLDGAKLFVSPVELVDSDVAWLVRTHKAAIVTELQNDAPAWAWLLHFASREPLELYRHPPATRAQVQADYPDAVSIQRLPESMWPVDPAKEAAA